MCEDKSYMIYKKDQEVVCMWWGGSSFNPSTPDAEAVRAL